jgi:aryl-alcohol dehydrogenase
MVQSRSAVLRGTGDPFTIEPIELEEPRPGEVLVRIVGSGLCHTDVMARTGLLGEAFLPAVLGHEGSGVIEKVGLGVTEVAPGDHVVLSFDSCGTCGSCVAARPAMCANFELHNLFGSRTDGSGVATDTFGASLTSRWFGQSSFGEYAIATARSLVKVDPGLPLELLGPLGCGIQTGAGSVLNVLKLAPGQSIAIFGAGAVGLSAVMAARAAGACDIVAVDLNPERRALALELGATRAVDGADPALAAAVKGDGPGLDCSFDNTGVSAVMTTAIEVLRRPGSAVLVGAGLDMLTVHPVFLVGKTVTYVYEGDSLPQVFIPRLIHLWRQGAFPFDRLIRKYPLDKINDAEADVQAGHTVKAILIPDPKDLDA